MRDFVSKKARDLKPSGIRKFFDLCQGSKDIISLGVGEPDFITPWQISDAGIKTIKSGKTQYTSNKGLEALREEISEYLKNRYSVSYNKEEIIVTVGASEAIDLALRAVLDEGDEVLVPSPSYVSYAPCVELCGGVAIPVDCTDENGFKLTPELLKSVITPKTKALIFPFPNNPTGAIMEREYLEKIIPVIEENDLLVIADEIYSELTYGENHASIAEGLEERTVYISGFSKAFAMTGWRVGYACAPTDILNTLLKIHQYSIICAPIFSQYAALAGLKNGRETGFETIKEMREEYDRRRKFMCKSFAEMGLNCFDPKGCFYIFPSVEETGLTGDEFAVKLLDSKKVAVVPGSAFGEFGKYYVRCSYAYSMKTLVEAMEKIAEFVRELKNGNK